MTFFNGSQGIIYFKASCRAATTANITLSGPQTIDTVSAVAGDRVLVKNQSTGSENGVYVVAAGAWSRSVDAAQSGSVKAGFQTYVTEGSANVDKTFYLTTNDPIVLGTTSLAFSSVSGMAIGNSITSATAGSVLFAGAAGVLAQDNANFFWDDTNNRLGIGTAAPGSTLEVNGVVGTNIAVFNESGLAVNFRIEGDTETSLFVTNGTSDLVGIGTNAPVRRLHVTGSPAATERGILTSHHSTDTTAAFLGLRKSRGTITVPTTVVTGDLTGYIPVEAYTTTTGYIIHAGVAARATGTVTGTSVPSEIGFFSSNVSGTGNPYTDGTVRLIVGTTATVVNENGDAYNFRVESDTEANMLFVDGTNNRVGIGTATPSTLFNVVGASAVALVEADSGTPLFRAIAYNAAAGTDSVLQLFHARGTRAAPTATQNGDEIGQVQFGGHDGTNFAGRSGMFSNATETWTGSARGTSLSFFTTATGASSFTNQVFIGNDGHVGIRSGASSAPSYLDVQAGSLADGISGYSLTGTLSTAGAAHQRGSFTTITANGTGAGFTYGALWSKIAQGTLVVGTGGGSAGGVFENLVTAAFNEPVPNAVNGLQGNYGIEATSIGTTTGSNVGLYGSAQNGNINIGSISRAITLKNSAANIGAVIIGRNTGTSPVQVGAYIGMNDGVSAATLAALTSAALIVDNSDQAAPIFIARDNGTAVFTIGDGATAVTFGTGFDRDAAGTYAIGGTNITTLSLGRSGQTQALLGAVTHASTMEMTTDSTYTPTTDNTGKVGTAANRFSEVHAVTVTTGDFEMKSPHDNGASGHWKLIEDVDQIVAVNMLTGKRYAIAMTPLDGPGSRKEGA